MAKRRPGPAERQLQRVKRNMDLLELAATKEKAAGREIRPMVVMAFIELDEKALLLRAAAELEHLESGHEWTATELREGLRALAEHVLRVVKDEDGVLAGIRSGRGLERARRRKKK